jgi:hypothetical protein
MALHFFCSLVIVFHSPSPRLHPPPNLLDLNNPEPDYAQTAPTSPLYLYDDNTTCDCGAVTVFHHHFTQLQPRPHQYLITPTTGPFTTEISLHHGALTTYIHTALSTSHPLSKLLQSPAVSIHALSLASTPGLLFASMEEAQAEGEGIKGKEKGWESHWGTLTT